MPKENTYTEITENFDDLEAEEDEEIPSEKEAEILTSPPVPSDFAGNRLDRWLTSCFSGFSRMRIARLVNKGFLSLTSENDGKVINSTSYKIKTGEVFTLTVPPPVSDIPEPQDIPLDILYEDDDIIVVNKAAGMVVHPGAGNKEGTLVNALLFYAKGRLSGIGGVERAGIVHRIDKDTSGILVIAKNDIAHRGLAKKFRIHDIDRVYKAICYGVPNPLSGTITGNIGRNRVERQKMTIVQEGGKEAITHYKTTKILAGGAASLVECRLETGRTHQIRVHLTSIGHPLVGDSTYKFDRKFAKVPVSEEQKEALLNFPRQALHAEVLGFIHPVSEEKMLFKVDMPDDMQQLYKVLSSSEKQMP